MKTALLVACLMLVLFAFISCASNNATTKPGEIPEGWVGERLNQGIDDRNAR